MRQKDPNEGTRMAGCKNIGWDAAEGDGWKSNYMRLVADNKLIPTNISGDTKITMTSLYGILSSIFPQLQVVLSKADVRMYRPKKIVLMTIKRSCHKSKG